MGCVRLRVLVFFDFYVFRGLGIWGGVNDVEGFDIVGFSKIY